MKIILETLLFTMIASSIACGDRPPSVIVDAGDLFTWSKENRETLDFVSIVAGRDGLALVAFSKKGKDGLYVTTYVRPYGAAEYSLWGGGFSEKIDYGDGIMRYVNRVEYAEDHDVLMYMYMPTGILSHSLPLSEAFSKLKQNSQAR